VQPSPACRVTLAVAVTALVGCAGEPLVTRIEFGRVEPGPPVAPSAYAASLRESLERARPAPVPREGRCIPRATAAAVDQALVRGDLALARRHATCARMHDAELSLRAWYFGHLPFAKSIADARLAAEPAWERRVVFAGPIALLRPRSRLGDALLAWGLASRGNDQVARQVAASIPREASDRVLAGLLRSF
jgi:hypothetical protein